MVYPSNMESVGWSAGRSVSLFSGRRLSSFSGLFELMQLGTKYSSFSVLLLKDLGHCILAYFGHLQNYH